MKNILNDNELGTFDLKLVMFKKDVKRDFIRGINKVMLKKSVMTDLAEGVVFVLVGYLPSVERHF